MPEPARMSPGDAYTGVDNLEVMAGAVRYRRFLARCATDVAGPPNADRPLLDFGAGTGTHAADLADLGYPVHCVEPDDTLLDRLRDRGFPAVGDLADLGDRRFATAYTFNVLEHIDDDVRALRGLRDVVEVGGRLVVYVPALQALFTSMDRKVGHLRRYRRRQLVSAVQSAGFEVERCRYVDSLGVLATLTYKVVGSDDGSIDDRAVRTYDRFVFPVSRALDRLLDTLVGKNLVLVARRPS